MVRSCYTSLPTSHTEDSQHVNKCPPPSRIFHGRQTLLDQMHQFFMQNMGKQLIYVLHGLGGSGKTQIALKLLMDQLLSECIHFIPRFTDIFFIDSSSVDTIDTGLKNVAKTKSIGDSSQDALQWLSSKQDKWMLFFDNADDPKINLNNYFPLCTHGNIIITSRNPGLCVYAGSHSLVSDMEETDATDLLLKSSAQDTTDYNKATSAQIALYYLPLAIIQAGAFISKSGSLHSYLDLYEQNRARLLSQQPAQSHDNYAWTVYTTKQISFEKLSRPATKFLQLCSLLHHQGISEKIFKNAATYTFGPSSPSQEELQMPLEFLSLFLGSAGVWDPFCFMEVTNEVRSYSLINCDSETSLFSIHPLVHQWTRSTLSDVEAYHRCVVAIVGMSLAELSPEDLSAEEFEAAVVQKRITLLGHDHPDTLEPMYWLSWIYRDRGKLKQAEELGMMVFEKRSSLLGDNHPDTLLAMGNLSLTYLMLAKWQEGEKNLVEVLKQQRNLLGDSHPDAMRTMASLASTYKAQGKLKEAEELEVVVFKKRRNVLGDNHPDTWLAMGNLATTYKGLGKLKEAEELQVVVLEKRRNIFGDNHPASLGNMGNLATTYNDLGKLKEAEELQVVVLEKQKNVR
ncbi:P-loop containing nucleoside triphosphate hydrolase protein [Mycena epipterygia]|nr:P-loop containing nucleoside triphosphate hydrolase protein [Mycena epipterygia]